MKNIILKGWADINDEAVNVTYYKSSQQLLMNDAWRKNNPKNTNRPYCVIARFGTRRTIVILLFSMNLRL